MSTHSEVSEPVNGRTQEETVWPVAKSDRASWTEKRNGLEGASSKPFSNELKLVAGVRFELTTFGL